MTLTIAEAEQKDRYWRKIHSDQEQREQRFPWSFKALKFLEKDISLEWLRDWYQKVNDKGLNRQITYGMPPCKEGESFKRSKGVKFTNLRSHILIGDIDKYPSLPPYIDNKDIEQVTEYCLKEMNISPDIGVLSIGSGSFGMKEGEPRIRIIIQLDKEYSIKEIREALIENNTFDDMSNYNHKHMTFCSPPLFLSVSSEPSLTRGRLFFRSGGLLSLSALKPCDVYYDKEGRPVTNSGGWSQWKKMEWSNAEEAKDFLLKLQDEGRLDDRRWGLVMFMGRAYSLGLEKEIIENKDIQNLCYPWNLEDRLEKSIETNKKNRKVVPLENAFKKSEITRINSLNISEDETFKKYKFKGNITVIKAPKGTGKSKASLDIWKNIKIEDELAKGIYIGTLKSTVSSMAEDNSWEYYLGDYEDASPSEKTRIADNSVFLATTDKSAKYDINERQIAIIDESEDVINNIIAGDTSLEDIVNICLRVKTIILMDADCSYHGTGKFIELLRDITDKKIQLILNTGDWGRTARHYFIKTKWEAINKIIKLIKEGNRVYVPFDRSNNSKDNYPMATLRNCIEGLSGERTIAFHAKSNNREELEKDVEKYLLNEIEEKDCRCLILSPAYYRSFSFLGTEQSHFNVACGIFTTAHRTHEQIDQFLSRCRRAMDKYICIEPGDVTLDEKAIQEINRKFVNYGTA